MRLRLRRLLERRLGLRMVLVGLFSSREWRSWGRCEKDGEGMGVKKGHGGGRSKDRTYEYPPATMALLGHLVFARLNRRTISAMAAGVDPRGRRFPAMDASYGPPTPWTQTFARPYLDSRASPRGTPRVPLGVRQPDLVGETWTALSVGES